jgi:predicted RND superfamily exporter protein
LSTVTSAGLEVVVVSDFLRFEDALDAQTESQTRGMIITLAVALLMLVGFFTLRMRTPMLGVIAMIPSALVVAWVAGSMWALGLSFNMMTAMVASLAIGIGVPYGIHITNRFTEDLQRYDTVDEAIRQTVVHTGGALVGSATTTAAGFGVLVFASLVPMQQFGIITAMTIIYSLIGAALIEPACLTLWARRREARGQLRAPQVIPG